LIPKSRQSNIAQWTFLSAVEDGCTDSELFGSKKTTCICSTDLCNNGTALEEDACNGAPATAATTMQIVAMTLLLKFIM